MSEKIDPRDLVKNQDTDARKWAISFVQTVEENNLKDSIDVDLMTTWFACAIMSQYDNLHNTKIKELRAENTRLSNQLACSVDGELVYAKEYVLKDSLKTACKHLDTYEKSWAEAFSPDEKTDARVFLDSVKDKSEDKFVAFLNLQKAAEDLILEDQHMSGCKYENFGSEYVCQCMDRRWFNRDDCMDRLAAALEATKV